MHLAHTQSSLALVAILGILSCALAAPPAAAAPVAGARGVAATAHPAATAAAVEALRQGGNAVDAAVAAAFALAVVEPYSSGLGGGGFALVRMRKDISFWDFREVAPAAATPDMYRNKGPTAARDGALSVAVPGAVAGYLDVHARFGKLERHTVMQPAIALAADGFAVTPRYRDYATWRLETLRADPEAARIFLVPLVDGTQVVPPLGHLLRQPELAATLREIAAGGARVFYEGRLAQRLVDDMRARAGLLTLDDLRAYRVRQRDPLLGSYRGHAVATAPPPSSGGQILLTLLNVLETLPRTTPWRDGYALHVYIEASRQAYADRALLGDPDFVPDVVHRLVAKERAWRIAAGIGMRATPSQDVIAGLGADLAGAERPGSATQSEAPDTTHLCVVDVEGNAVSMTTTVNYGFGAGIVAAGTGVLWNDQMDDFAAAPGVANAYGIVGSVANAVAPGKVPLSSMAPTFVFGGADITTPLRMVVGSPGGSRIPSTVAQAIVHHLDHGANIEQSLTLGRVHHQHLPDVVRYEPFALEAATLSRLRAMGHTLEEQTPWSNATAIAVDPATEIRTAAADPRGEGSAAAQ